MLIALFFGLVVCGGVMFGVGYVLVLLYGWLAACFMWGLVIVLVCFSFSYVFF